MFVTIINMVSRWWSMASSFRKRKKKKKRKNGQWLVPLLSTSGQIPISIMVNSLLRTDLAVLWSVQVNVCQCQTMSPRRKKRVIRLISLQINFINADIIKSFVCSVWKNPSVWGVMRNFCNIFAEGSCWLVSWVQV